jgi:hypothetical protein
MSTKLASLLAAHYILLARSFVVILGCIAVWWGIIELPVFWRESSTERIADRIIAGEPFNSDTLSRQLPVLQAAENSPNCRPSAVRSAAIIRLRIVEYNNSSGNKSHIDEQSNALRNSTRTSLSCSPADPFLWLVYYWMQSTQNGPTSEQLKYLRMSYQLGPNEGWIALKRNRLAFAIIDQLPPDLAENAIDEFVGLLDTGFYEQAAEIFTGPAWHVRNLILARLDSIPDRRLKPLANAVHRLGYEVGLPRIDEADRLPWQKNQ